MRWKNNGACADKLVSNMIQTREFHFTRVDIDAILYGLHANIYWCSHQKYRLCMLLSIIILWNAAFYCQSTCRENVKFPLLCSSVQNISVSKIVHELWLSIELYRATLSTSILHVGLGTIRCTFWKANMLQGHNSQEIYFDPFIFAAVHRSYMTW